MSELTVLVAESVLSALITMVSLLPVVLSGCLVWPHEASNTRPANAASMLNFFFIVPLLTVKFFYVIAAPIIFYIISVLRVTGVYTNHNIALFNAFFIECGAGFRYA